MIRACQPAAHPTQPGGRLGEVSDTVAIQLIVLSLSCFPMRLSLKKKPHGATPAMPQINCSRNTAEGLGKTSKRQGKRPQAILQPREA